MSFAFGTPSSAPATGLTSGFNFGANKPATPGFGLATTQSAGVFGTPTSATSGFGATPAFGATPSFGSAPAFGTTTGFGATTAAPAFGATATPTFGATSTAPTFGSTPAPAFGSTAATPAFGAAAPAFGSTPAPSFGAGLGTGGLNFGAGTNTSTAGGLLTGTQAQSTAAPGLGGLGGFGFGSSTAASTGFNLLGSTNTATSTSSFFGSKLGVTSTTGTQPATSTTPSLGLGGIAPNASGAANTTTSGDGKGESPKQTKLPNEISTTVNSFEEFVKKQKAMSSEIMRVSIKPLHQVARSAEALQRALATADSDVRRARGAAARLRARSAALAAAADRAKHAAAGCEAEEGAPAFMLELLAELARQLASLRRLTGAASDQLRPAAPRAPAELTDGIRRMHEGVISLAARLQAAHAHVQARAMHYRQLRARAAPSDDSDGVLHSLDAMLREVEAPSKKTRAAHESLGAASLAGPTPFSCLHAPFPPLPPAPPAVPPAPGTGWNSSGGLCGLTARGVTEPAPFALQKPPGKRGKQ